MAKFIEKDLKEAIPYLSAKNDMTTYGKPNKWMAKALLAKLYINWAVYTASDVTKYDAATATNEKLDDCVKVCDDIIQSGLFDLTSTQRTNPTNVYRAKFYPDNNYKVKDFIYAMPYDAVLLQGMTYARFRTWKKANKGDTYYGWSLRQLVCRCVCHDARDGRSLLARGRRPQRRGHRRVYQEVRSKNI